MIEERGAAFLLENDEGKREFFPKSQVSFDRRNVKTGDCVAIIPIWLLEKKDF